MSVNYKKAGVDENKAEKLVEFIKIKAKETFTKNVIGDIGLFGGFFKISEKYKNPVFVSSTDGVGTKILIAQEMGIFKNLGIDLVAMNCNDVSVCGADVLFFLDYIAVGEIKGKREQEIIEGIVEGCKYAECSLIGGEISQMKDVYGKDGFDLAGFCVGIVEREDIVDENKVKEGNVLIGVASSGVHSNGFSLVRKIFKKKDYRKYYKEFNKTLGEELLKSTYIYSPLLAELFSNRLIITCAHITGGGIKGNLIRVIPEGRRCIIEKKSWVVPEIFYIIQKKGKISEKEMFDVFNMGIGLILVVEKGKVEKNLEIIKKHRFQGYIIGQVEKGEKKIEIL
ncbi:MAG: phosphoribosylformylglycinamidine cyclo-ligase [Candidatus Omnitrophica bacterium]|nr:phosphoribosylformylglycinamidine cyclo-ligase [Candidatus Omnitrophota bacterium]MCM8803479.1 phosphoribosylformylglycinamidine cyclo-ligase [Candidatus Omnitrophota bacterium]